MQTSSRHPWGKGTPTWVRDATANDSDKSFTVPAGKMWVLLSIHAEIVCTATAGNRSLAAVVHNGTANQWVLLFGATTAIAANLSGGLRAQRGLTASTTAFSRIAGSINNVSVAVNSTMPDNVLPEGYVVHVWDTAAIDAAADDLTVLINYIEYDA